MPDDPITAPWTPEQADALNRFQTYGGMHPFTCGAEHHHSRPTLVANTDGWRCPDEDCTYSQTWAHAFMAKPETWPKAAAPGWEDKGDGIWTLPVDGGTVLYTTKSTPEERARFAEEWAKGTKPDTDGTNFTVHCADCLAGVSFPDHHRQHLPPPRIVPAEHCGHLPPQTSFTTPPTECVLRPGHQGSHADDRGSRWRPTPEPARDGLREQVTAAVSPILEEWPEHNRIDEHEHVTRAITDAVLAVFAPKEGRQ